MTQITINNIVGLVPPYSGYVCNVYGVNCYYIGQITTTPVTFILPPPFDMAPAIGFKLIDSTGCERFEIIYCLDLPPVEKQFQDEDYFYFMDYELYHFQ